MNDSWQIQKMSPPRGALRVRLNVTFRAATQTTGGRNTCAAMKQNTLDSRNLCVPIVAVALDEGMPLHCRLVLKSLHSDRGFRCSDTLRRHIRQRHKRIEPLNRARRACENCHAGKSRCEGGVPCDECLRRKIQCSFDDHDAIGTEHPVSSPGLASSPTHSDSQSAGSDKGEKHIDLYFEAFHPVWPFIHRGSFNIHRETPLLLQSMTVIGLWCSGEKSFQSAAVELHEKLHLAIRDQKVQYARQLIGRSGSLI